MVERPRLSERLRSGLEGPVTLVCAPAGSGKTALVAAGAQRCRRPVAWVTLEPTDDEPGRLWEAVLTALGVAGAVPADSALAALAPPVRESRDSFMPLLVNALAELAGAGAARARRRRTSCARASASRSSRSWSCTRPTRCGSC